MELLKLNPNPKEIIKICKPHGYEIDTSKSYYVDVDDDYEFEHLALTRQVRVLLDETKGMKSYEKFCKKYGLISHGLNKNKSVEKVIKKNFPNGGPLWKDEFSQGIAVEVKGSPLSGNMGIVVEMSRENSGFKYTRILATIDL